MIKRLKRDEDVDDLYQMEQEYLCEKAKNPKLQPAAHVVKCDKGKFSKKSIFAANRKGINDQIPVTTATLPTSSSIAEKPLLLGEVAERISSDTQQNQLSGSLIGDIIEKKFVSPRNTEHIPISTFEPVPKMEMLPVGIKPQQGKSIFAQIMEVKSNGGGATGAPYDDRHISVHEPEQMDCAFMENPISTSVIVADSKTAADVHKANTYFLSGMEEADILDKRQKLIETTDPSIVAFLSKKREEKRSLLGSRGLRPDPNRSIGDAMETQNTPVDPLSTISNTVVELLQSGTEENWLNFDVIERDKLEWMRDMPIITSKLKLGEEFEARFDWKGLLLPYTLEDNVTSSALKNMQHEQDLYLHGDEPHRPGYTIQELFRLARSHVTQQRVSAFGAIAGILNMYNQGFYDNVVDLPITKMFFLLRYGLDDNTLIMLETVSKALSFLFYNEADETMLDHMYENPSCHWQPTLQVLQTNCVSDDPLSVENLQKQMEQLEVRGSQVSKMQANIKESEEESTTSMSDFQLAETDLIDCFLRTNILQRIHFILHMVRPDNSTVSSCMKLLIRLARTDKEVAVRIVNNDDLMNDIFEHFLPGLERVDTSLLMPPFYNYPQYLCLKLFRILIAQSSSIAIKLLNLNIVDKIQNYLYSHEDIKSKLIKVQIECLRILRSLLLLRVDETLYKTFLPAFRYMLEWHCHHDIYDVHESFLIRQHASALVAAVACGPVGHEENCLLSEVLYNCCCKWFHGAARSGVNEFSQATLLSVCLNAVRVFACNDDSQRFHNFSAKYLRDFLTSPAFVELVDLLIPSSVLLSKDADRRNVHPPLPNMGGVAVSKQGPQMVLSIESGVCLFVALWRLLELPSQQHQKLLRDIISKPPIVESFLQYLLALNSTTMNRYLASNFFAKMELRLIVKLLCSEGFGVYLEKAQMLKLVYNTLGSLPPEYNNEVGELFERVIFNKDYMDVDEHTLKKWKDTCMDMVHSKRIFVPVSEMSLSMPSMQMPILSRDWPYFQLKTTLRNYLSNEQEPYADTLSEREVLEMTINFVSKLEKCNPLVQIATPTEKLMYWMIAFMGPDSQFLEPQINQMLRQHLKQFYEQCKDHTFHFDAVFEGKCKFENLYVLFIDHFQAASYGDELFASLVLLPLAQKYNNKWRRRVWSDCGAALTYLNCDESLLIGGLEAYLEPPEEEASLLKAYRMALLHELVRPGSVPYKIAVYHLDKCKERLQK